MIRRGSIILGMVASASLSAWGLPAPAQDIGDPDAGKKIAETWCVNCHVVAPAQAQGTSNGAPAFSAIAAKPGITPMALRAFLQTPHHRMPDLQLSREQIDDVTAYIQSLRGAAPK